VSILSSKDHVVCERLKYARRENREAEAQHKDAQSAFELNHSDTTKPATVAKTKSMIPVRIMVERQP